MSAITPSLADVGALIRARTKDTLGNELGTFTTETRPTASEAQTLIDSAEVEVASAIGPIWTVQLNGLAKRVTALRAAQFIERTYFPEQASEQQPAFLSLRWQYEALHTRLVQDAQARALSGELDDELEDEVALSQILDLLARVDDLEAALVTQAATDTAQDTRLDDVETADAALEAVDTALDGRLDTIEAQTVVRSGAGVPSNSLGKNGDVYIDTTGNDVYLRAAGTYSVVVAGA